MNKASKTVFEKHVASAYTGYDWSSLELDKSGKLSPHGKKTNLKCYESFSAQYPSVCPTFEYFKLLSRFFLSYHLNTNRVISSYVCPVCRSAPKKGICNSGKNGKYKGETCGSLECQTELRKRTNMEKGGNTCALHRSDSVLQMKNIEFAKCCGKRTRNNGNVYRVMYCTLFENLNGVLMSNIYTELVLV